MRLSVTHLISSLRQFALGNAQFEKEHAYACFYRSRVALSPGSCPQHVQCSPPRYYVDPRQQCIFFRLYHSLYSSHSINRSHTRLRESRCKSILSRLTTMGMMRSVCSRMKSLQLRGCRVNLATLRSHRMSPAKRAYRLFHTNLKLQASRCM